MTSHGTDQSQDKPSDGVLPAQDMLTLSEVSQILNVHPNSVRRWSNMGLLTTYRFGCRGDRRFRRQDVEEFLNSWDTQPVTEPVR